MRGGEAGRGRERRRGGQVRAAREQEDMRGWRWRSAEAAEGRLRGEGEREGSGQELKNDKAKRGNGQGIQRQQEVSTIRYKNVGERTRVSRRPAVKTDAVTMRQEVQDRAEQDVHDMRGTR